MAEYIVQGESLTALADEIRELSDTADAMGLEAMANHIGDANTDIDTEAGLIAQIQTVLEGKVSGSSIKTASIYVNATNGTTFKYIGENGLNTIYDTIATVQMVVPSICFAAPNALFSNISTSNAEILFNTHYVAIIYVFGESTINVVGGEFSGG